MSTIDNMTMKMIGHMKATDLTDPNNPEVIRESWNAIHPQNVARVFARALANEPNHSIYRIALGNGGTTVSAGNQITYNTPNDGQSPDPTGWQSRLYNETYSEVIDESSVSLGTGPGADPSGDPVSDSSSGPGVRSVEQGIISLVNIDVTLNANEPTGQLGSDNEFPTGDPEGNFVFDELGLYTAGKPPVNTVGTQTIKLLNKNVNSNTGLATSFLYQFNIRINGGTEQTITITTPSTGSGVSGGSSFINYADLLTLLNTKLNPYGVSASITDTANGVETNGNLVLSTTATGPNATIALTTTSLPGNWLFNHLLDYDSVAVPVNGSLAGVQNNAADPSTERERLLTHLIFSPILKSANRTIRIEYSLSIAVARTE